MKIAIVNLTAGGLCSGYRNYLHEIVPLMQKDARVSRLEVFFPIAARSLVALNNVPIHIWPKMDMLTGYKRLKRDLLKLSPDIIFIPNGQWASFGPVPTVVMIRNMEPLINPIGDNSIRICSANIVRCLLSKRACLKADRIIAISSFVKNFLTSQWGIHEDKIGLVRFGVKKDSYDDCIKPMALDFKETRRFIFTAGSIAPYRGIEDLLNAVSILKKNGILINVVIAGRSERGNEFYLMKMKDLAERLNIGPLVSWAGHINKDEMAWCYKNCAMFVMTSRVETCPNIALEAMSYGCLTISTDSLPMPEFFDNSARYYEANDVNGLAQQIEALLSLPEGDKIARKNKAVERSKEFDWDKTVEQTISELEIAIKQKRKQDFIY